VIGHTVSTRSDPERPEFAAALAALRAGDVLVFWESDRWGRSAAHVLTTIGELRDRSVTVRSLTEKALASFANRVAEFRSLSDRARARACVSTQGMDTAATVDGHRIRPWPAANLEYPDTSSRCVSSSAYAYVHRPTITRAIMTHRAPWATADSSCLTRLVTPGRPRRDRIGPE
jgi:hypothetical protein